MNFETTTSYLFISYGTTKMNIDLCSQCQHKDSICSVIFVLLKKTEKPSQCKFIVLISPYQISLQLIDNI